MRWSLGECESEIAEGHITVAGVPIGEPWQVGVRRPGCGGDDGETHAHGDARSRRRTLTNSWDYWVFDVTERSQEKRGRVLVRSTLSALADVYPFAEPDTFGFLNSRRTEPDHDVIVSDVMHVRYVEAMVNGATMLYLAEGDDLQDGVESRFESYSGPTSGSRTSRTNDGTDGGAASGAWRLPHEGHSDWQWYHLVDGADGGQPRSPAGWAEAVVGAIDNWNRASGSATCSRRGWQGAFLMTTLKLLDQFRPVRGGLPAEPPVAVCGVARVPRDGADDGPSLVDPEASGRLAPALARTIHEGVGRSCPRSPAVGGDHRARGQILS